MTTNKQAGQYLKELRIKQGLSQLELSKALGYDIPQFVSMMENAHSSIPLNILPKLVKALKMDRIQIIDLQDILVTIYDEKISKAFKGKKG